MTIYKRQQNNANCMGEETQRTIDFFKRTGHKLAEGRVWIQGRQAKTRTHLFTEIPTAPVFFDPSIEGVRHPCMPALLEYLKTYQPITERGFVFYPEGRFSLVVATRGLDLILEDPRDWGQSDVISVINPALTSREELEEHLALLSPVGSVSSVVMGSVLDTREYGGFTVLRRWYLE